MGFKATIISGLSAINFKVKKSAKDLLLNQQALIKSTVKDRLQQTTLVIKFILVVTTE